MRYLFGDSTPFPLPFDFLRTLEAFMIAGTRVVLLDHKAQAVADKALAAKKERAQRLDALSELHKSVLLSLSAPSAQAHAYTADYTKRLIEHATNLFQEQRRSVKELDEEQATAGRGERERANEEIAMHLRTFFQNARLPLLGTRVTTTLLEGRPVARALLVHPGGITVSVTLGTSKAAAWNAPRKLSELGGPWELMVGIKKSFFGGKVTRELVRLDDWVIGSAELDETTAMIAIRKKADQKDTLIFKLRREGTSIFADVESPGDPNAGLVPPMAETADLPHLDRLWTALLKTFDAVIEERAVITKVSLEGADVFERGLGKKLVERIITVLSPIALEVARRSPNSRELSLKCEGDSGRREELYLKRDDLLGMLEPLPSGGREVFAPLGLDDWVPAATKRPPEVSTPAPTTKRPPEASAPAPTTKRPPEVSAPAPTTKRPPEVSAPAPPNKRPPEVSAPAPPNKRPPDLPSSREVSAPAATKQPPDVSAPAATKQPPDVSAPESNEVSARLGREELFSIDIEDD
jgi:hypothetical protein